MKISVVGNFIGIVLLSSFIFSAKAQTVIPEVLDTGTINQQLDYLQNKTNVYNKYRAVRDDMFLKLKSNVLESEKNLKTEINQLNTEIASSKTKINTLQSELDATKAKLKEAVDTKNSFNLFGINIDKVLYNSILWIVILALGGITAVTFLLYKRSMISTNQLKKEYEELKGDFELHKKETREKQEKLVVAHHKEMMKLKKEMGV